LDPSVIHVAVVAVKVMSAGIVKTIGIKVVGEPEMVVPEVS
jgi:hypothetical protein